MVVDLVFKIHYLIKINLLYADIEFELLKNVKDKSSLPRNPKIIITITITNIIIVIIIVIIIIIIIK